nr:MAG TPA: hypothetical protein [Bacteriophage sp.]
MTIGLIDVDGRHGKKYILLHRRSISSHIGEVSIRFEGCLYL